jgi:hypothetical protein
MEVNMSVPLARFCFHVNTSGHSKKYVHVVDPELRKLLYNERYVYGRNAEQYGLHVIHAERQVEVQIN